jgi:uncharacterized protein YgiM (DUF1202 family)
MRSLFIYFVMALFCSGCVFKGIDSCVDGGTGANCTPVSVNLKNAANPKSDTSELTGEYAVLDNRVAKEELKRLSNQGTTPQLLKPREVRIRIYPYSDGERYFDARDVYTVIQKAGYSKGSTVYMQDKVTVIQDAPAVIPDKLYVSPFQLNVRSGAGNLFEAIATLNKADEVNPVRYRNGWYEINLKKGGTGWVNENYLTDKKPIVINPTVSNTRR